MSIWIVVFIGICFLFFYYYIMSTFVHFMNTFIIVPIIKFINGIIKAVNVIIDGINKPFEGLHNLKIGASLGKIFGKKIGFEIQPFKPIIPEKLVPSAPSLAFKCIREPVGYKTIFKYKTPKECPKKSNKKKKKKIAEQAVSSLMNGFIIILLGSLLVLLWFGMQDVDNPTKIEGSEYPLLNESNNSERIIEGNNLSNLIGAKLPLDMENIPTGSIPNISDMAKTAIPTGSIPNIPNLSNVSNIPNVTKIPSDMKNIPTGSIPNINDMAKTAIPNALPNIPPTLASK